MSIIGPRPWIPEYYENFNNRQKQRVNTKPGIIGLAQVNGRKKINTGVEINKTDNRKMMENIKETKNWLSGKIN